MKVNIGKYVNWWTVPKFIEDTWAEKYFESARDWVFERRNRKIKVEIHSYDTWSMDSTLAYIIVPMLKQLKETKQGSAIVDDVDVPEHLKGESEDVLHLKWDYVLDSMIESFESVNDTKWENPYYSTKDYDGLKEEAERLQKGFELFGKYYRNLWD